MSTTMTKDEKKNIAIGATVLIGTGVFLTGIVYCVGKKIMKK